MASEYEDKYLLLRDENTALKKKKNEQEATIKRMYTKLAMIEESLKKKRQTEGKNNQDDPENEGNKAVVLPVRRDLDTEKFVAALKNENTLLRKKNQSLMEKNRWLEEQGRRTAPTKRGAAPASRALKQTKRPAARNNAASSGGFAGDTPEKQTESARKLHRDTFSGDLEVALKKRLVIAEKQLVKLQKENEQLRGSSNRLLLKPRQDNNNAYSGQSDEDEDNIHDNNSPPTKLEIGQMKRELRDRQAQLAILNARYENLESNALAEREIQEKTLSQMEQMNRQVHKLRTQLQDAIIEKEELEMRLSKSGDQEKDITSLREQNRRLEERMTSLCESPFINDAFQRKERIDKLFELEKLTQEQKATIFHLTEENQSLQVIIRELQSSIKQLKQSKDIIEQDLQQMTHHLMEERNAWSLEAVKSAAGASKVPRPEPLTITHQQTSEPVHLPPPEKRDACSSPVNNGGSPVTNILPTLNMAGNMVRRNYGDLPTTANFCDAPEAENDCSVKHLRNRVHLLQIAHLKSMQELERCEKMLHAQTNINRELALEIEELTTQKILNSNQLQRRMKELELVSEERQQRIHVLQAEIRQLKYAREKMLLKAREADDACSGDSSSDDEECDNASLSESLILAASDLAPGEQLVELGISSGNFDSSAVGINSSTFVLCDFYDFESQTTPLLMGSRPEYNLSATFKVTVDGFFLRYLASESIVLEVYQSIRGDFKLIGKASVRLSKLLQSKGVVKEPMLAIKSSNATADETTMTLGTLNVNLRLSTPISEIWQVHLRSYPQDIQLISTGGKSSCPDVLTDVLGGEDFNDDAGHSTNELQITIFACRHLRSYGKRSTTSLSRVPSSYAHYQLLGFPDIFTNIVSDSSNPEFDLNSSRQAFTLDVDACLLRFFCKFRFWVTVFDDQVELDDSSQDEGILGRCGIMLSDLVNGDSIRGWFPLKDQNDRHAGDISILIQWKDPFQVLQLSSSQRARGVNGRPFDLHSLDFDQQHALLSMFSADMDGRVNYRQFLHYAAPSKELELVAAKLKERFESSIDSDQVASVQDALTSGKLKQSMLLSVDNMSKAIEKYGIFLSDTDLELLLSTFKVLDVPTESGPTHEDVAERHGRMIALNYLLLHINPRLSCVERLLCHKIRETMRGYLKGQRKRKPAEVVPADKVFEKFDETNCGRITRSEFRKCLCALGFDLLSVESEYRELVRAHTQPANSENNQVKTIVTSPPSSPPKRSIDLDESILEDNTLNAAQQVKPLKSEIARSPTNVTQEPKVGSSKAAASVVPAATEFQRRKQAFIDRMKTIASSSSKNLVYEQVEKKLQSQRVQMKPDGMSELSRDDFRQQQRLEKRKLDVKFSESNLNLPQLGVSEKRPEQRIPSEDETRLTCALEAAFRFSLSTFQKSFQEFQEFCVVHGFGSIAKTKLWRQLEANGMVGLLSKRGAALLAEKFSTTVNDEDSRSSRVSLKAVHSYLKHFLNDPRIPESQTKKSPCKSPSPATESPTYRNVLSELLLWCDERGIDFRGEFELFDPVYTGFVTGMELKQTLLRLGIAELASPSAEAVIGQLVRQYRSTEKKDAVHYTAMLSEAISLGLPSTDSTWYDQISEDLRSRIRSKSKMVGKVDHSERANYSKLDAAFNHFDRQKKGFLTTENICSGLRALNYELTAEQLKLVIDRMSIFRHDGGGLSRTEFDSFVLDPYAFQLLRKLSQQLYADVRAHGQDVMPRVAYLSRLIMEKGGVGHQSSLPKEIVWAQMERALERKVTTWERNRLQHLFDVGRNGQIAFKLFLKAISQWRKSDSLSELASPRQSKQSGQRAVDSPTPDSVMESKKSQRYTESKQKTDRREECGSEENERCGASIMASPKTIHSPKNFLNNPLIPESQTKKSPCKLPSPATESPTYRNVLSELLLWCDERGIDFRGEFELFDPAYTGFVTGMELKQTLLRLGIAELASPSAEAVIGQLVRQYRSTEKKDAVHYTAMLSEAISLGLPSTDSTWYDQISEDLRSRIRSKSKMVGKVDHSERANYSKLDAAFNHFDRQKKGFLTTENICSGLRALNYELTAEQLKLVIDRMSIFRHDGGGLSRTEFDSFVLDPYAFQLLRKLSQQLYADVRAHGQDVMPRVAYLSRLIMENGGVGHQSSLPKEIVWAQMERALERKVTTWERNRLQHLFDVGRNGQIAFKLFLKAISQWRKSNSLSKLASPRQSKQSGQRAVDSPTHDSVVDSKKLERNIESTQETEGGTSEMKPPCARNAILRSLYNQMSSVDFASQLDIVEEYLRVKDRNDSGSITGSKLKRVFDQIGLPLSEDAFSSLQMYFPGTATPDNDETQGELVSYENILLALQAIHRKSDGNGNT